MSEVKMGCVRDVIHDYIYFTLNQNEGDVSEKDIIDSPWLQRQRRIFQLQATWMVFPCATHTRFQHALGTMHLAGHLAWRLYDDFKRVFPNEYIPPERTYVEEVFRLAGLLHDIGHGPLGHLIDDVYTWKKYGKTHEDISAKVITGELAPLIEKINFSPHGYFHQKINPETLIKFIKTPPNFEGYALWEQIFSKIMLGVYSVDIIDFLLRDKYYCGTKEFGSIDIKRLLDNTVVTDSGFSMEKEALPAFKNFLATRMSMFCHIYFNEKKQLFETSFGKILPDVLKLMKVGDPYKNLRKYFFLDDYYVNSTLLDWSKRGAGEARKIGRKWEKIAVLRETPFAMVLSGQKSYFKFVRKSDLLDERKVESFVRQKYRIKCPVFVNIDVFDVRLQNVFAQFADLASLKKEDNLKCIALYDSENDKVLGEEMNKMLADIPVKFLMWQVYVPSKYGKRINAVIKSESEAGEDFTDFQLDLPLGPLRWDEKKEKTEITNA
ncbi:MAG: HD domain-containing protein [Elusimicrobia bacterium]|nr:HD domain-containing protein [Elusimicrobiota bacterium]